MKKIKRLAAAALIGALCLSVSVPAMAYEADGITGGSLGDARFMGTADEGTYHDCGTQWYGPAADGALLSAEEDEPGIALLSETWTGGALADCAERVKESLMNKETEFTVEVTLADGVARSVDEWHAICSGFAADVIAEARKHTGKPLEGDYLASQAGFKCASGFSYYGENPESINVSMKFSEAMYYTTAEEDELVIEYADGLIGSFGWTACTSDYAKVLDVYDWMCENVVYAYDYAMDSSRTTVNEYHSAYGLFSGHESVCQGFATAMYCTLLRAGVGCRIVDGYTSSALVENGGAMDHMWNLVELGGEYYYIDVTWDADNRYKGLDQHTYFLLSEESFTANGTKHIQGDDFDVSMCLMAASDFDAETNAAAAERHNAVTSAAVAATCTEDGLTAGTYCSLCGETLTGREAVPATGHDLIFHEYVAATETEDGNIAYYSCNNCGTYLDEDGTGISDADIRIPATGALTDPGGTEDADDGTEDAGADTSEGAAGTAADPASAATAAADDADGDEASAGDVTYGGEDAAPDGASSGADTARETVIGADASGASTDGAGSAPDGDVTSYTDGAKTDDDAAAAARLFLILAAAAAAVIAITAVKQKQHT